MVAVLFLLGLVFGSFLNVLILRYKPQDTELHGRNTERRGILYMLKTAGGRSRCVHCGHQLRWYELVPVISWIIQLGRCRNCKKWISLQYPVVELASAAVFVFVPWAIEGIRFNLGLLEVEPWFAPAVSAFWIIVFLMLIAAFFIDVRHFVIPNLLNFSIFVGGAAWTTAGHFLKFGDSFAKGSFLGSYGDLFIPSFLKGVAPAGGFIFNHLLGAAIGAGFFLLVIFITRGKGMGLGDAKLMAGLGLLFGYPDVLIVMALAFLVGTIYSVPLLAMGKKGMKSMLPFGPFIVVASFVVFFFGARILGGYFGIIGTLQF